MEKVKKKYDNLVRSYKSFQAILKRYSNPPKYADQEDIEAYMTTLIKRFELAYESLWKFLKIYLEAKAGIFTMGSKDTLRKCYESKLITELELAQLLNIIEDRNLIVQEYNLEKAKDLSDKIKQQYAQAIEETINKISLLYQSLEAIS